MSKKRSHSSQEDERRSTDPLRQQKQRSVKAECLRKLCSIDGLGCVIAGECAGRRLQRVFKGPEGGVCLTPVDELSIMASLKKSLEGLKSTSQSATRGVTDSAVQAAQDAVQQVAESSKETAGAAAEEASRQTQSAIGTAAGKASDSIKEFGHKFSSK